MTEQPSRPYRWTSIGGHLALDLCNTRSWRLDPSRSIDRLATPADLIGWHAAIAHPAAAEHEQRARQAADGSAAAEQALIAVRSLRDATIRIADAHLAGAALPKPETDHVAAAWRRALEVAPTPVHLPWRWRIEPAEPAERAEPGDLVHVLALSVADLLHQDLSGLRCCAGDGCGWFFLDTTRNHSRRWCDPLDCGNRARVRNYVERRRSALPRTGA